MGFVHLLFARKRIVTVALLLLILSGGCSSRPAKFELTGTVTLDERPLKEGTILLTAINNSSSEGGTITEGRYSVKVFPGQYKVMLNAAVRKPNLDPPTIRSTEWNYFSIIPARYNERSTLTVEVFPREVNQHDFSLSSEK
jgi:hypothetical protein